MMYQRVQTKTMQDYTFEQISEIIKGYYEFRGYKMPSAKDAAIWLVTESGELLDALMRREDGWVRNNTNKGNRDLVADELADVLMMASVAAMQYGYTAKFQNSEVEVKLARHDRLKTISVELNLYIATLAEGLILDLQKPTVRNYFDYVFEMIEEFSCKSGINLLEALLSKFESKGFKVTP